VLDAFDELRVCTAYKINGTEQQEVPYQMETAKPAPVYKNFPGWKQDSSTIKDAANLPVNMSNYVSFINEYIGAPVQYISNGPGREQLIFL